MANRFKKRKEVVKMPVKWSKPKTAGAKPKAKKPVNENPSKGGKSKGKKESK